MLEDEKITSSRLLFWSEDGTSFVCPNPTEFSKDVLPNYFKHNNWQSFVRQLNMYSFNKVSDLYSTANSDPQAWEFRHPLFRRGEPNLLSSIKRKSTRPSNPEGNNAAATSPNDEDSLVETLGASKKFFTSRQPCSATDMTNCGRLNRPPARSPKKEDRFLVMVLPPSLGLYMKTAG
ncbi:Flocculation suppression protein [Vanrija albida]|uniref:Flocculation suppression protein n=1 Tax=Vanrija albida TaxID=181172 RepID=A0ABR3Q5P9_9TREE